MDEVETRVCGIPCIARVTYYHRQKPDYSTWTSDWDYYGYEEIDFEICDRRGRPAPWLAKKLTSSDEIRIEQEISEYMKGD